VQREDESVISRLLGAMLALGTTVGPAAAESGDSAAGHRLAQQFCSSCHIVGSERAGSDVAPPFRAIAADPEKTFTEIHAWHGPMHPVISNLALSATQIADINAYLDSLRPAAKPPPTPTKKPPAPIRNAPPDKLGEPIQPKPK
jgi:mono/diheme cytochrome c family protein